jgi:hypothetical protein
VATIEEALDPLLVTTNPNSQGPGPISATELRSAMSNFAPRLWRDYSGQLHFQYQEAIDSMAHGLAEMLENQIPHTAKPPLEDNPALAKGQSSADEIKDRPRQTSHDQPDSDWGLEHEYKPIDLPIHTKETTTGTIRGPHSLRSIISEVFSPAPKTPSAQPSAMATNTATPPAWPWKERVSSQSPNGDEWNVDAIYDGPTRVSPHWTVRWIPTGEWVIACDYEELYFYKFPSHTSAMAAAEDMDATLRSHQSPTDS